MLATKIIGIDFGTKRKRVVTYTFGPRSDNTCRRLPSLVGHFQLGFITSDDWGSYAMVVPREIQLTRKIPTQRIELNNLTLRTNIKRQARKIICFSRSFEINQNVIGAFIKKCHFN